VETVANQLEGAGFTWKGYMEDMNAEGGGDAQNPITCLHPAINSFDGTQSAHADHQYAARHNPFVYFHSIIDFPTCDQHDVDFSNFATDLKRERTTPNYSFITPNLCDDGHDAPCVTGDPGGLVQINSWLKQEVPPILHSRAYRRRGLLMILFDEADAGPGGDADASACCHEQPGPNTPNPGGPTVGPGGGRTGAVFLSPCIEPGTVNRHHYNHYSMLRSVEDNFGLSHLGYAGQAGLHPFGAQTLNRHSCGRAIHLHVRPRHADRREPTEFKVRVHAGLRECRSHVRINLAHRRFKTNRRGRARIEGKLLQDGRHRARATKDGCKTDRATVRVP
jgi:phosphatidylinositol-3-phosphatase